MYFFTISFGINLPAQNPAIIWQNTIGGGGDDDLSIVRYTADGGCIAAGVSSSPISYDKTEDLSGFNDF